jgi:hypothetical protein
VEDEDRQHRFRRIKMKNSTDDKLEVKYDFHVIFDGVIARVSNDFRTHFAPDLMHCYEAMFKSSSIKLEELENYIEYAYDQEEDLFYVCDATPEKIREFVLRAAREARELAFSWPMNSKYDLFDRDQLLDSTAWVEGVEQ